MKEHFLRSLKRFLIVFFSISTVSGVFVTVLNINMRNFPDFFIKHMFFIIWAILMCISLIVMIIVLAYYVVKFYEVGKEFAYVATHDTLTDLENRNTFADRLKKIIEEKKDFSLVLINIHDFRSINDFNSHQIGDFVLKTVARRLESISFGDSQKITVSRYSGDKFILLCPEIISKNNPKTLFYIRQIFSTPIQFVLESEDTSQTIKHKSIILRTSIGIVNSKDIAELKTVDDFVSAADIAMNEAKKLGKNKYIFFEHEMRRKIQSNAQTARVIESACQHNGFSVVFQPQITAEDGTIHGYEALVRMPHTKIEPREFIPIAEEASHIAKIGRIVTEKVIKQIAEWQNKNVPLHKVSINYSVGQLEDKEYMSYLKSLMETYSVSPDLIGIEITESLFMGDKAQALKVFNEFDELGIKIALDDFGTGFSSLSYLTFLPLEIVKIDKSFIDTYLKENDENSSKFILNITNLVHSLGMKITIEGVEDEWQFKKLKEYGCDYIQGYYFSKPLPANEIESFIPKKI